VLSQPTSPFPLQRLTQLYRERDGGLKGLVADFEKRANDPGPDRWNARVVLAAIYREDGRLEDATKTYESAAQERPKSPAPLLALAQLARDRGDAPQAMRYFEQALPLLPAAERETTLRSLIAVALDLKDSRRQKFLRARQRQIRPGAGGSGAS
jgi:tetratricopeptide (TPR) repeat protein